MNRFLTSAIGCMACVSMASVAEAQMVRIGPFGGVSVRAPFVSVDTLPFGGGTRVRAPFTSINTRAYAYGYGYGYRPYRYDYYRPYGPVFYDPVMPVYPVPVYTPPLYPDVVYPITDSVAASGGLPERLRASALQLKRSLSLRRDDSDVWLNYLAPDRIVQTIDEGAAPGSLSDLLRNYEGVTGNASLVSIRGARGFSETYRLLRAFVSSPADSSTPKAAKTTNESDAKTILVPQAVSKPDLETKQPTPAAPLRPAGNGEDQDVKQEKEELPLPPPAPTPL
jgi:hypothetical protein